MTEGSDKIIYEKFIEDNLANCCSSNSSVSRSVASHSLRPHGLQPARLLCPWDSPGKNTGVGSHPGDLSNPGIKPGSPTLQADSSPSEPEGKSLTLV